MNNVRELNEMMGFDLIFLHHLTGQVSVDSEQVSSLPMEFDSKADVSSNHAMMGSHSS